MSDVGNGRRRHLAPGNRVAADVGGVGFQHHPVVRYHQGGFSDFSGLGAGDPAAESQEVTQLEKFFGEIGTTVESVQHSGDAGKMFQTVVERLEGLAAVNDNRELEFPASSSCLSRAWSWSLGSKCSRA